MCCEYNIVETAFKKYVRIHANLGDGTRGSETVGVCFCLKKKMRSGEYN